MNKSKISFQNAARALWAISRKCRYVYWGIANRLPPGRFSAVGSQVKFNGWIRFEKPYQEISIGNESMIGVGCYLLADGNGYISIGSNVGINDHCYITSLYGITIEDDVHIAEFVSIRDYDHEFECCDVPIRQQGFRGAPISIGKGSWIGRGVMVTSGVTIGQGCVVGANAVVTRNLPDYSVAVGAPARIIRSRLREGEAASSK